ncbi:hypothetical protein F2Q70_00011795 [Brassica cretica]|uniref:Aspartic peptidase DDI1-type domain-containing protein n=1 Tax=Brassica cretica TaxID=69181 RepID=A0A8S9M8B5_BRACR|nr:hypothetical protein F2Q70_00011795 [Brassica cretica]
MIIYQATEGQTLRIMKQKVLKHLRRGANEKEMGSSLKGETKETDKDIVLMFHQIREKMKQRVVLKNKKKKSDAGNFVVPCLIGGIDYPLYSLCDTGSSVSVMPKVMADHLSLKVLKTKLLEP